MMAHMTQRSYARRLLGVTALAVGAGLGLGWSSPGPAQEWPDRAVQVIVSYGAGGGTDRQTRVMARYLEEILEIPVTVQNLPGAGSQVATTAVYREEPDGYTILATNEPDLSMTVALYDAPYSRDDFSCMAVEVYDPRIIAVREDSPYQTFADFVEAARANPGQVSISVTTGGAQELFARWLMGALDLDVNLVGYPSGGEAATALLGGHVDATAGDDFARFNIREDARALIIGSPERSPRWPEADPMTEALAAFGVEPPTPDFLARYHVYAVRSEMQEQHPERYKKLQEAILSIKQSPEYQASIAEQGFEDLALMAPCDAYEDNFRRTLEVLRDMDIQ